MQSISRQLHAAIGAITSATKKDRTILFVVSLLTFSLSQTLAPAYAKSFIENKSTSAASVNSIESKKYGFRNIELPVSNFITTCISLKSRVHYILKSGACNPRIHESRAWYAKGGAPEGTPGAVLVDLNICTSKKSGTQIVRKKCNQVTQTSTTFQRRHGQPAALNIPTVKMATLGSAFISFAQPSDDGGANITHYTISSVPHSAEAIVFSHDKKIGHITNLLPGTHYQFAVSATNSQGTSLLSAHTASILVPNLPNKATISSIKLLTDTSAELLFQPPDFDGGAEITSYSAIMIFEGGRSLKLNAKQLDTGKIEIAGLPYSSTFTISLFAHNVAGASLASEPSLSITTPPSPPPPCQVDPNAILEITEAAIGGVSLPSTAATKPTTTTSAHGYSGSISWSFTQLSGSKSSLADSAFGAMRTYTATIQLTPDCPKGKIKVPSNFFTVSGASSVSNAENSGVITAVFPATGPGVPNKA
ncbi:MAG TPA: fibronectin type III domain-containing protein, partial [Candidatus Nanopelagicaceae bacterium]